jgi:hypothetical protein
MRGGLGLREGERLVDDGSGGIGSHASHHPFEVVIRAVGR